MKHLLTLAFLVCLGTFASAQIPSYVPPNGLVGWWPFNGNANDESGNGNHGTVNGATLAANRFGNAGKAYSFDGVDDRIRVPFSQSYTNDTGTVLLWMKTIEMPNINDNQACLFAKGFGYPQLVLRIDSKVYIQIANSISIFPSLSHSSKFITHSLSLSAFLPQRRSS